ncbi:hypothetical protein PR202_ga10078 [Eleusine coracana subsp. coracana]|uniref:Wall-associated receptor kinase galacturonan-binding domain-containing protein n=1 Tax=Eleusine coracana subsp. coracana TaxID=191504 RepID=A0AAV5C5T1_ELECO|nr:hypothetical protein PR202_ga10078 [Eleusine coracana subsp. coracana]
MAPLLPLLLLILLAAADTILASCSNATCAGLNISYPFWLNSSGYDNCGYPGLGLACENNTSLILFIQFHRYRVTGIDYIKHTVAVSDTDAGDEEYGAGCPRLHWNLTIDYTSSWLQLAPSDSNITILYNCKKNISSSYAVELSACQGRYDNKWSYVLRDGAATGTEAYEHECEEVVVAPVLGVHKVGMMDAPDGIPPSTNGTFGPAGVVEAGFELMYHAHSEQCDGCESSGGWCGYQRNGSADGVLTFTCFCDGGPNLRTLRCVCLIFPPHY